LRDVTVLHILLSSKRIVHLLTVLLRETRDRHAGTFDHDVSAEGGASQRGKRSTIKLCLITTTEGI